MHSQTNVSANNDINQLKGIGQIKWFLCESHGVLIGVHIISFAPIGQHKLVEVNQLDKLI